MDANSKGAADLLRALMRTAARFSETGRSLSHDFFPHFRSEPIADLAGRAVRLGMEVTLPGHELLFEVGVGIADGGFTVSGDLMLDGEEAYLELALIKTADAGQCLALLDRYVDELTAPARWHVGRLIEACGS